MDLARDADGRWQVLADRTQAPSGAGYALENRQIVSRALPELYRDLRVQHLAGYFRTLQETLASQAAGDGETPLVVLLTPGRFNETYFEHLYLARQLGFPLVEGHDLTVRDATLYLKTLGGLKRVHAVLRRLDDDFCDPLELRTDSALGIPGLLEAVRQGRVLVANALGMGWTLSAIPSTPPIARPAHCSATAPERWCCVPAMLRKKARCWPSTSAATATSSTC